MKIKIARIIGGIFTLAGIVMIIKGYVTDGFLSMILGELIDIPKYDTF